MSPTDMREQHRDIPLNRAGEGELGVLPPGRIFCDYMKTDKNKSEVEKDYGLENS